MSKNYDKWKKHSVMYWWSIVLLGAIFIITLVIRLTEFQTGTVVTIILVASGISILVMGLLIIRYLLDRLKPYQKR